MEMQHTSTDIPHKEKSMQDIKPRNPRFLYLLTACSTIGGFLFGYDTGVISGALVLLKTPQVFNLSTIQSESVVSAAVFGAILGASLCSCGNQILGRKPMILISSFLFLCGSCLMGAALDFQALLYGRLIVGLGIGMSSMTVPLYIAEVSPPDIRGQLVSLNTVFVTGGQFFACALDAFLSGVPNGWRYMLGLAAIPALIQFIGFVFLPESPRYLIARGETKRAYNAFLQIRGAANTDEVELEFNQVEKDVLAAQSENGSSPSSQLKTLLNSPPIRRALMLGCVLQALQQFAGINTVMYYGASIIQMAGFANAQTAIWLSVIVSFSNFIFTFAGLFLVDRAGRRMLTLGSLGGSTIALFVLGLMFYLAAMQSIVLTMPTSPVQDACGLYSTCFQCISSEACGVCIYPPDLTTHSSSYKCIPGNSKSVNPIPSNLSDATVDWLSCPVDSINGVQWNYSACPADSKIPGILILVALFLYLAFFASGMGPMPWTINAEIYPLHIRSLAISITTSVNWCANLIVSATFLSIIDLITPAGAFWVYGLLAVAGFLYLYIELPETKGLKLEEIHTLFEGSNTVRQGRYEKIEKSEIS